MGNTLQLDFENDLGGEIGGATDEKPSLRAARILAYARHAVVITGAGLSAPSGLPTFRGSAGSAESYLWSTHDPIECASVSGFMAQPEKLWNLVFRFFKNKSAFAPNDGHRALQQLCKWNVVKCILTCNVDNLQQEVGTPADRIIEVHGTLRICRCLDCGSEYATESFVTPMDDIVAQVPHCTKPSCNGILKPACTLFGEALPVNAMQAAERELRQADVVVVVGSSSEVQPVAMFASEAKHRLGATVIEVNVAEKTKLGETGVVDVHVRESVVECLPEIVRFVGLLREGKDPREALSTTAKI